jgi:hypothetical protein
MGYTPIAVSHQLHFWLKLGCDNFLILILVMNVSSHELAKFEDTQRIIYKMFYVNFPHCHIIL